MYFTSIEKKVLTSYTNLSQFCFLGTTQLLVPNVWANENPKVDTYSNQTWDPKIVRLMLYLTTTDITQYTGDTRCLEFCRTWEKTRDSWSSN